MFLSTSTHKIDRKGRVSVPAHFRAALEGERFSGVVLTPPFSSAPCVEGFGMSRADRIGAALRAMNPLSEEADALATATLARMRPVGFDAEGRIVLPPELIAVAELEGQALFAGLGEKFQIWRPEAYAAHERAALERARAAAGAFPWAAGGATGDLPSSGTGE